MYNFYFNLRRPSFFYCFHFHLCMPTNVILLLFKFKPEKYKYALKYQLCTFFLSLSFLFLSWLREKNDIFICLAGFFCLAYSFYPPTTIEASRKQQKTSIYDRWDIYKDTGWLVERENIVVKDISSIDGTTPKGWMLHSVVSPYNQQKGRTGKNYNQSSSSFCP